MTLKLDQLLLVLGGTLLAIGLILGFLPASAGNIGCGTAFTGVSSEAQAADLTGAMLGQDISELTTESDCKDTLSGRRTIALALTLPGAALVGAGLYVRSRPQTPGASATP